MREEEPDRQSGYAGNCEFLPLRDTSRFDRRALGRYLGAIGIAYDPEQSIQQFAGGFANRNYLLEIDGRRAVLRRPPSGELPKGAHDMAREHRILRALSPVFELAPASLHYCSDPSVIGAPFQLLEYREGLILRGAELPGELPAAADEILGTGMIGALASIHAVDLDACGLGELGRPIGFLARNIDGWRRRGRAAAVAGPQSLLVEEIAAWLDAQRFADRAPRLLHSDFKLDNLVLDPATLGPRAVLDWDMGTRGDPIFDLATLLSYWTQADDPPGLVGAAMMPTAAPGFSSRQWAAERYAKITGCELDDLPGLYVLALLKLGVVFLQLHHRWLSGSVKSRRYALFGEQALDVLAHAHQLTRGRAL